ncbi:CU044_5270 family protein [Actinomadura oligospora]|uniref:CU044_5270 family protein n=1 Tax=Actinomadura oligospora TaxID=111804 RepID=UPI0004AE6CF5|nr:CU044_5270 family protein [Actinomadura oligospora]
MKRDAMEMLMNARPDELDPNAPVDAETREREMARAKHGAHGTTTVTAPARRRVRPVWGLGLAGVAAAAVAAAVLVPMSGDGGGGTPAAKKHDGSQSLDGRTVLLTAAETADRQPAASGAFWHVTRLNRQYMRVGSGAMSYTVVDEQRDESWTPNSPTGLMVARAQQLGAHPVTDADKAMWRKAGSPTSWQVKIPAGNGKYKPLSLSTTPGKVRITRQGLPKGAVYWLGRNVTMKQVKALPSDPKTLKAELLRWYQGHGTEAVDQKSTADEWLFDVARGLVTDMAVSPKVRAAAFRMLAGLPSVASLGKVTDDRGRTGVAIAMTRPGQAGAALQSRLIINPSEGRALGSQDVLVKQSDRYPGVRAGSVLFSILINSHEWTASAPS